MATNLTYTTLITDLQTYADKGTAADTKVYAQLPRLINDCERSIVTAMKLQGYERTLNSALVAGLNVYDKPDRIRTVVSMRLLVSGESRFVYPRSADYCRIFAPDATEEGVPSFYAEEAPTKWLLAVTPDDTYDWQIKCYLQPDLLDELNTTNWLTEEAPNLLKARCMMRMAVLCRRPDDIPVWDAEFKTELGAFSQEDIAKIMDRASERDKP